jgi:hypothetical protein
LSFADEKSVVQTRLRRLSWPSCVPILGMTSGRRRLPRSVCSVSRFRRR